MHLSPSPRPLLAPLLLLMVALAACAPTEELASSPGASPSPAVTASPSASASPSPSASPVPSADSRADDDDQGDDQDRAAASGDCDAYLDSSTWCTSGIGDYDCDGGSGNGPNYAPADIRLVEPGVDPFGLDRNNDGHGCEQAQPAPPPDPEPEPEPGTDPRFGTCAEAKAAGYGPYYRGAPEYSWYRDADGDGIVCE